MLILECLVSVYVYDDKYRGAVNSTSEKYLQRLDRQRQNRMKQVDARVGLANNFSSFATAMTAALTQGMRNDNKNNFNNNNGNNNNNSNNINDSNDRKQRSNDKKEKKAF